MAEEFDKSIQLFGKDFILCGTGTRKITFLKFAVYKIGIYVEKSKLEEFRKAIKTISWNDEDSLCSKINSFPMDIAIQLCMIVCLF